MKIDRVATAAQHYKDPKSYRTLDGREILFHDDWEARKLELWERCGGQCEHLGRYFDIGANKFVIIRCPVEAADPHHVEPRWPKRDDRLENLLALCRWHHSALDERKPRWTAKEATA